MSNPFLEIEGKEEHELFLNEEEKKLIEEYAIKLKAGGKIVAVVGEKGSGKTRIAKEILKKCGGKIYEFPFQYDLIERLKKYPLLKEIHQFFTIYIEDFEKIKEVEKEKREEIITLLEGIAKAKIGVLVTLDKKTYEELKEDPRISNYLISFEVRPLTLEETKKLVESRLKKAEEKVEISEKEIKKVWKAAKGNPKMILMLLAQIYESKRK